MARLGASVAAVLLLSLARRAHGDGFMDQVRQQAGSLEEQAEGLGDSISTQVTPALAAAQNSTVSALKGLKHGSEKAAVKALLWASGKCPELWEQLPENPARLAVRLSEAFASSKESPSTSKASCRKAAQSGLEGIVDSEMATESDEEKFAVKMSLADLMDKVCTDDLMEALTTMESLRTRHRAPYLMAIGDRLLLKVLTQHRLRAVLTDYCGGADGAEVSGLYMKHSAAAAAAPASPVSLLMVGMLLSVFAGVVAARRCQSQCSLARLVLGGDALEEAERGLVVLAE